MSQARCSKSSITFLIGSLRGGGGERICVTLANALAARGWVVELVVLNLENSKYQGQLNNEVKLVNLQVRHVRSGMIALWKYLYSTKPSVVLTFAHQLAIATLLLRPFTSRTIGVVARTGTTLSKRRPFARGWWHRLFAPLLTRAWYGRSDAVIAQSRGMSHDLVCNMRIPENKVVTIPNPLPLWVGVPSRSRRNDTMSKTKRVLFVGRLDPVKDPHLLLKAFEICLKARPDLLLDIVGVGSLESEIKEIADDLKYQGKVVLHGFVSDVRSFYVRADVSVLCSHVEGMPNCLLESIACGTPVVAIDCEHGPSEIIAHEVNGLLVRSRNERMLAEAILKALNFEWDPDAFATSVARYELRSVVQQYESAIRAVRDARAHLSR